MPIRCSRSSSPQLPTYPSPAPPQADRCPALTCEALSALPNLTELTLDTLNAPEALTHLARLRCLSVKKLVQSEVRACARACGLVEESARAVRVWAAGVLVAHIA